MISICGEAYITTPAYRDRVSLVEALACIAVNSPFVIGVGIDWIGVFFSLLFREVFLLNITASFNVKQLGD